MKIFRLVSLLFAVLVLASPAWALEEIRPLLLQSAVGETADGRALDVANFSSVALQVTISDTATVTFEGTEDGSTWASKVCSSIANTSATLVTTATATGTYQCNIAGLAKFRARVSAWTGGTVTVHARASTADLGGGGGGGGGGTEFAEDSAHTSGDNGTQILCVRRDANTTLADTTGDYAPCQVDSGGNLKVAIISGGGTGGTSLAEDGAHSDGENITPLGCRRIDTAATSAGTSGDWATVDCDANGALRVRIDSTAVGANSQDDDGTVASGSTGDSVTISKGHSHDGTDWKREGYDPCRGPKTFTAINISTATTTELTASLAGASTNYYVCSINLVAAAAQTAALVDDDTDNCASVTSGLAGGTSAATGWSFAANGGIAFGNGQGTVFKTAGTNRVLCLVTGQAAQLSGSISYVAAP